MELLQWHKVCEVGGEELHRPPVVALNIGPLGNPLSPQISTNI